MIPRALYRQAKRHERPAVERDTGLATYLPPNSRPTDGPQLAWSSRTWCYQNAGDTRGRHRASPRLGRLAIGGGGLGTKSAATEVIMTQGSFEPDLKPLDVAIEGHWFLPGASGPMEPSPIPAARPVSTEQPGNRRNLGRRSSDSHHHPSANATAVYHHPVRGGERDSSGATEPPPAAGPIAGWPPPQSGGLESMVRICCRPRSAPATRSWASRRTEGLGTCSKGTWKTQCGRGDHVRTDGAGSAGL